MEATFTRRLEARPGTVDAFVFEEVFQRDHYRLPRLAADDAVVDIGAHVGAFSRLAVLRGSRQVVAFEPDPENFARLRANTQREDDAVLAVNAAVVGGSGVHFRRLSTYRTLGDAAPMRLRGLVDTACASFFRPELGEKGPLVFCVGIGELLRGHSVRFLKLDCEGSEWDILDTPGILHGVQELAMEYHSFLARPGALATTIERIEAHGFEVTTAPSDELPDAGMLYARRKRR